MPADNPEDIHGAKWLPHVKFKLNRKAHEINMATPYRLVSEHRPPSGCHAGDAGNSNGSGSDQDLQQINELAKTLPFTVSNSNV